MIPVGIQAFCDGAGAFIIVNILMKYPFYNFRFFGNKYQLALFNGISEQATVAPDITFFHASTYAPLDTLGYLSGFLLGQRCHDRQTKFAVLIISIDTVIHENDVDIQIFQLSGVVEGIDGITGETADFFCKYSVNHSTLAVGYHFIKPFTMRGRCSCNTFIIVNVDEFPIGVIFYVLLEELTLSRQRVDLITLVSTDAAVRRYSFLSIHCTSSPKY